MQTKPSQLARLLSLNAEGVNAFTNKDVPGFEVYRAVVDAYEKSCADYAGATWAENVEAERLKYERSLFEFFKRAWQEFDPSPLKVGAHHWLICKHLEAISHGEFTANGYRKFLANVPPRCTKSNLVNVCWLAWMWAQRDIGPLSGPQVRFLAISYGDRLSKDIARTSRRLILSDWYQGLWGHQVKILDDQSGIDNYGNTAGGSRIATSMSGATLGRGGDVRCLDDPHKIEEAESEDERQRIVRTYDEALSTRDTDPSTSVEVCIMQRIHECLLPGTKVRVPQGEADIEALKVGDLVFGSDGWQRVEAVGSRDYDGVAFGVRLYAHPTICWTTDNHLYLTRRGWIRADELTKADEIRFPIRGGNDEQIPWEPPLRAPPPKNPSGNFTGSGRKAVSRSQLFELVELGLSNIAIGKRLGVHRNTVQCYMWAYGLTRIRDLNPIFGLEHLLDQDFWRVVGYWLAEGSMMNGRHGARDGIRFTFGRTEGDYVTDITKTLGRYGVFCKSYLAPSVICVEVNCSQLGRWCERNFGSGAHQKHIPEFVFSLPADARRELLEGWLRGDGCYRTTGPLAGQRAGSSVSMALLHGFQRIALSLGIRAQIVGGGRPSFSFINGKRINSSGKGGEIRFPTTVVPSRVKTTFDVSGEAIWTKIKEIEKKPYSGRVIDIATPSHDFVVGNATVHNSDISGHILSTSTDDLVHLCLPMRYDPERHCQTPWGEDWRTEDGELLWPEQFPAKIVDDRERRMGPYAFHGQYQQLPSPRGGGIIEKEWWQVWPEVPPPLGQPVQLPDVSFVLVSLDTAISEEEQASYNACTVWGIWHRAPNAPRTQRVTDSGADMRGVFADRAGMVERAFLIPEWVGRLPQSEQEEWLKQRREKTLRYTPTNYAHDLRDEEQPRIILMEAWRRRCRLHDPTLGPDGQPKGLVERVLDTARRRHANALVIENKTRGKDVQQELQRMMRAAEFGVHLFEPRKHGDKVSRLLSVQPLFTGGLVYAPVAYDPVTGEQQEFRWCQSVISEIAQVPKGQFNDLADSSSQGLIWLREAGLILLTEEHIQEQLESRAFRPKRESVAQHYGV